VSGTVAATQSGPWTVQVVTPPNAPASTTVTNPATAPVQTTNVDKDGRIPYQSKNGTVVGPCSGTERCVLGFPVVPANHRLVVRHISGSLFFGVSSGNTNKPVILVTLFAALSSSFTGFFAPTAPPTNVSVFDQPVLFYIDAGQTPTVALDSFFATFG